MIDTGLNAHLPETVIADRVARTPLRRIGDPLDVAHVIRLLVSDEARAWRPRSGSLAMRSPGEFTRLTVVQTRT